MIVLRQLLVAAPAALLLFTASPSAADALPPERSLFTWTGQVDREATITINGRNISTKAPGMVLALPPRVDVREAMPASDGEIRVQLTNGRGNVQVLQQPNAGNNYTGIVRIVDAPSGQDSYRVIVSWLASGTGSYDPRATDPNDPRYDPRTDPRNDPRYDPRTDPRNRDSNRNGDWDRDRDGRNDDCYDNNRGNNGKGKAKGKDKNKAQGKAKGHDKNRGYDDDCDDHDRYNNNDRNRYPDTNRNRSGNIATWRGSVDSEIEMRIQGRRIDYRTLSGQPLRSARFDAGSGVPRANVQVAVNMTHGRGNVNVVQQPDRNNNYTTVIRVVDRQAGYGSYDFDIRWF